MKNKELFWLLILLSVVILVTIIIFSTSGFEKNGVTYTDFIEIDTLGINFWISKLHFAILFASLFFFISYLIKVISSKFKNNLVNIVFIISDIALLWVLQFIRKLGYISMLTGNNTSGFGNEGFFQNNFWTKENMTILSIQIILVILVLYTGILTIKKYRKKIH